MGERAVVSQAPTSDRTSARRPRGGPAHASRARSSGAHAATAARPTRGALAVALPEERRTPQRGRHLRPVEASRRSPRQVRRTRMVVLLSLVVLGVAIAFALVYLHVVAAQRQFTLDGLNKQVNQQEQRYDRMRLQVAQLEAPARIISTAEGQYGMTEPQSVTYLVPKAPAPATRATPPKSPATTAPAGDANWPKIKSLLKGSP